MKKNYFLLVIFLGSFQVFAQKKYQVISYLDIKVDSMGNLPQNPYVLVQSD
jgi:hypothetical protein